MCSVANIILSSRRVSVQLIELFGGYTINEIHYISAYFSRDSEIITLQIHLAKPINAFWIGHL